MDVHRGRFIAYPTHAITAAAFTRANDSGLVPGRPAPPLRLALGRKNGDVEIWNPQGGQWIQESVFPGEGEEKSIDGLLWTQEPDQEIDGEESVPGRYRLFSISSSSSITEWNLATGTPTTRSSGNFSQVWCFAAQPLQRRKRRCDTKNEEDLKSSQIVAGCANGTLVQLSTEDGQLEYLKTVVATASKGVGCLCVTYQTGERVVAGFTDGQIRILDVEQRQTIRLAGVGKGLPGAPKVPYIWQVKCLPNGDIISGDSDGGLKYWNGKSYAMIQSVTGQDADCLGLVVSADGKTVFSSSIDGRIAMFRYTASSTGQPAWAKISHHRIHDGEVKSIAAYDGKNLSVVMTGGVDVSPIINPIRDFGKKQQQILPGLPQDPPIASARHGRLLASWWDKTINIWRIYKHTPEDLNQGPQPSRRLVASMELDIQDKIRYVSLSEDGRALAVSTSSEVKVFQLRRKMETYALGNRKLAVPSKLQSVGARLMAFSPDGKWLVVISPDSEVYVLRISSTVQNPKLSRVVGFVELEREALRKDRSSELGNYRQTITRVAFASDSSVLVTADLAGNVSTWILEGEEDKSKPAIDIIENKPDNEEDSDDMSDSSSDSSDDDSDEIAFYGQQWKSHPGGRRLPKLDSAPTVLLFRPQPYQSAMDAKPNIKPAKPHYRLWILTAKHQMYEFDLLAGRLSDWSRKNPTSSLPQDLRRQKHRVVGGIWDSKKNRSHVWLHGIDWLLRLDVSDDVEYPSSQQQQPSSSKRKWRSPLEERESGGAVKRHRSSRGDEGSRRKTRHTPWMIFPTSFKRYEDGKAVDVPLDVPLQSKRGERGDYEEGDDDDYDDDGDDDVNVDVEPVDLQLQQNSGDDEANGEHARRGITTKAWTTSKYRPILGMVSLGNVVRTERGELPEMVIIERPPTDTREILG